MIKLSIIIPTRNCSTDNTKLLRAVNSIYNQTAVEKIEKEVIIAIDKESPVRAGGELRRAVVVESTGRTQTEALNAALEKSDAELIAFLEDDDFWDTRLLEVYIPELKYSSFITTNQIEHDGQGMILGVQDFPTPSGWLITRGEIERVGRFNEDFLYHFDNNFLGMAKLMGLNRTHMIESLAPNNLITIKERRPQIYRIFKEYGENLTIKKHRFVKPLVYREVRSGSNMGQISTNPAMKRRSRDEYAVLRKTFGSVPW